MPPDNPESSRAGVRVTLWGALANAILIVLKLVAGIIGQSNALIADAVHSASDFVSDAVVLVGLRASKKGPDQHHHFGHGRIETLAASVVAFFLLGVAVFLGFRAVTVIQSGQTVTPNWLAVGAAAVSIAVKEGIYQATQRVAKRTHSAALAANAWHHRSDALTSVAALVGVGAAQIRPEWRVLDAWAALVVAGFVVYAGGTILWASIKEFLDTAPPSDVVAHIHAMAQGVAGVVGVHDLKVRTTGGSLLVNLHIEVDGTISVTDGHEVADAVAARLKEARSEILDVTVHVDPAPSPTGAPDHRPGAEQQS